MTNRSPLPSAALGPSQLIQNQPRNGEFGAEVGGTAVAFNGVAAPVLYTSATQVAAIVPYAVTAGHAAAINAVDGSVNTAVNPVKIGGYISLYATGEGQTTPAGRDGKLAGSTPTHPVLPLTVMVGGLPATVHYAGGAPGLVAGLMQVNVQIPSGVQPGGYVAVVLRVGDRTSSPAVWIAVGD